MNTDPLITLQSKIESLEYSESCLLEVHSKMMPEVAQAKLCVVGHWSSAKEEAIWVFSLETS